MQGRAEEAGGREVRSAEEESSSAIAVETLLIQAGGWAMLGTAIGRWPPGTALGAAIGLAAAVAGWRDRSAGAGP